MPEQDTVVVDFLIDGSVVESIELVGNPPRQGETVELGAKFDEGERLDPNTTKPYAKWESAEYRTVLRGVVKSVTRHYHTAFDHNELTYRVELTNASHHANGIDTTE